LRILGHVTVNSNQRAFAEQNNVGLPFERKYFGHSVEGAFPSSSSSSVLVLVLVHALGVGIVVGAAVPIGEDRVVVASLKGYRLRKTPSSVEDTGDSHASGVRVFKPVRLLGVFFFLANTSSSELELSYPSRSDPTDSWVIFSSTPRSSMICEKMPKALEWKVGFWGRCGGKISANIEIQGYRLIQTW
jgi:hypothetical protein